MYNREEAFEKYIRKKAEELLDLCGQHGIPTFMTFCVRDEGKGTNYENYDNYKNYMYGSASNGIRLNDDQILRHVNVANGFTTSPPGNNEDLDNYFED